jgi:hypothetical protein
MSVTNAECGLRSAELRIKTQFGPRVAFRPVVKFFLPGSMGCLPRSAGGKDRMLNAECGVRSAELGSPGVCPVCCPEAFDSGLPQVPGVRFCGRHASHLLRPAFDSAEAERAIGAVMESQRLWIEVELARIRAMRGANAECGVRSAELGNDFSRVGGGFKSSSSEAASFSKHNNNVQTAAGPGALNSECGVRSAGACARPLGDVEEMKARPAMSAAEHNRFLKGRW